MGVNHETDPIIKDHIAQLAKVLVEGRARIWKDDDTFESFSHRFEEDVKQELGGLGAGLIV